LLKLHKLRKQTTDYSNLGGHLDVSDSAVLHYLDQQFKFLSAGCECDGSPKEFRSLFWFLFLCPGHLLHPQVPLRTFVPKPGGLVQNSLGFCLARAKQLPSAIADVVA
jgi:hypothetical protein